MTAGDTGFEASKEVLMRMLAAVLYEQGLPAPYADSQPFRIDEVDLEGPGPGEVLVEIRAAGLCHSDLSFVAGLRKRPLPIVGGHEAAGIVREVGGGVTAVKKDDHVVMTVVSGCDHCRPCAAMRPGLCQSFTASRAQGVLATGARRLSRDGRPIYHYSGISGFAQYSVNVPGSLIKIDPNIPFDDAAMFGCAVVTGVGAVFNTAQVRHGEAVAVLGLGGVGLNAVMAARIRGAQHIIGIDVNESKFALAKELGATEVFNASAPDLVQRIRDLTNGGVDYSFEVAGNKSAMATAYGITCRGGQVVCVGLGKTGELYQYPAGELVTEEKVIRGSFMGSCVPKRDIPRYLDLYRDRSLPVDRLKSEVIGFDRLNVSLDLLSRAEVVRQILHP